MWGSGWVGELVLAGVESGARDPRPQRPALLPAALPGRSGGGAAGPSAPPGVRGGPRLPALTAPQARRLQGRRPPHLLAEEGPPPASLPAPRGVAAAPPLALPAAVTVPPHVLPHPRGFYAHPSASASRVDPILWVSRFKEKEAWGGRSGKASGGRGSPSPQTTPLVADWPRDRWPRLRQGSLVSILGHLEQIPSPL